MPINPQEYMDRMLGSMNTINSNKILPQEVRRSSMAEHDSGDFTMPYHGALDVFISGKNAAILLRRESYSGYVIRFYSEQGWQYDLAIEDAGMLDAFSTMIKSDMVNKEFSKGKIAPPPEGTLGIANALAGGKL